MAGNCLQLLRREADIFHRQLVGGPPSDWLVQRYLSAHCDVAGFGGFDEAQLKTVQLIVDKGLHAVAIEPWLRNPRRTHALSIKLLLMSYLLECEGHPAFSRSGEREWLKAMVRLGGIVLKGAVLLMVGYVQRARYGLL